MLDGSADDGSGTEQQLSDSRQNRSVPSEGGSDYCGVRQPIPVDMADPLPTDVLDGGPALEADAADGGTTPTARTTGAQSDDHTDTTTPMTTTNPTDDDSRTTTNDHTLDHGTDDLNDPVPVDIADGLFGDDAPDTPADDHALDGVDDLNEPAPVDMADDVPTTVLDAQTDETTDDGAHPMTTTNPTDDDSSTDTTTDGRLMTDGGQPTADDGTPADEWSPAKVTPPTYGDVKDPEETTWIDAVYAGFNTQTDAAAAMDASRPTAGRHLNNLAGDDDVDKWLDEGAAPVTKFTGGTVTYAYDADAVADDDTGSTGSSGSTGGSTGGSGNGPDAGDLALDNGFPKAMTEYPGMLADRRHDLPDTMWDGDLPDASMAEYHPTGDEFRLMQQDMTLLKKMGDDPSYMEGEEPMTHQLIGETGTGKTHAAKWLAANNGALYMEVNMADVDDPADLKGMMMLRPDDHPDEWVDGPLVKALLATQAADDPDTPFDNVVLALDEVNRAPPSVRAVFMSVLDKRCAIDIDRRAGETVEGRKHNLIVVSTANPHGSGRGSYDTFDMDDAQASRLGNTHNVDYLGRDSPGTAADMLVGRAGVTDGWAAKAVAAANAVREAAYDQNSAVRIRRPFPTRDLIRVANNAEKNAALGSPEPVREAYKPVVADTYEGEAKEFVLQAFNDKLVGPDAPDISNGEGMAAKLMDDDADTGGDA